jgi:F-type H+-transporting ATPase subunit a
VHEQIGEHSTWVWPLVGRVHADTILTTWLVMLVSLAFFWYVGRSYRTNRVNKTQSAFEGAINYLSDLAVGALGPKGEPYMPIFVGMFFFIFILNQIGFFPFKLFGLPFGGSPTADISTTVAFAAIVFFGIQYLAIRKSGIKAYSHLFKPFWWLFPMNVIEETARPIVLALRLFFNIFVGELLLFVISSVVRSDVKVGPVNLSMVAAAFPFFVQLLNFFIGSLQAFVFTLLAIVYLSLATADEH